MAGRVMGLSRQQKPPQLLSQISGREKQKLEQQPDDINALPLSSEDEAENDMPAAAALKLRRSNSSDQMHMEQSGDSEPETSARVDIKRTAFNNPSTSSKTQRNTIRKVSQKDDNTETSSSSAKRRKLDSNSGAGPPTHLMNLMGFPKQRKSKTTYGGSKSRESQISRGPPGSQENKGKAKVPKREPIHETTEEDDFLHSSQTEEKPTFKPVSQESFSSPTQSGVALRPVPKDDLRTPSKAGKTETKSTNRDPSATPTKSQATHATKLSQDENCRSRSSSQSGSSLWNKFHGEKPKKKNRPQTPEYKPARFVAPAKIDHLDGSNSDISSLSSPVLSDLDQLSDTETIKEVSPEEQTSVEDSMTKCPWCGDLVSGQALKDYSKGKRLNVQMQTRFCAKHKKETALETWRERGYPHIDWNRLEDRLVDHRAYLTKIVDGKQSFFRDILAEKIETGQARSLKKEGNLNPGYYGPRGCKLMCDYLVEEFGELLKEKATKDRVIAGRGSAAFIQSVLVAELAVQLIMEDMDVSASEAREIMKESKALGELIHEEP
ncbi:hypothetical protein FBEOM_11522 [Fusarium beomiforme]|uniref:Restriction of telomere capping protein 4 n=1 Tax=Fusarium beomiforme TaxID=44412 RepID=A0A9P5DTX0_9HYPO|nr:hypothetical protein FBEOM_11522 [Fusarium beomiforme]